MRRFFHINFRQMFSLGSFRVRDYGDIHPGTYWYEITFLFIEVTWGAINTEAKLKIKTNE